MMAIDLSKQQELDVDAKAIQQINFTGNLNRGKNVNDNTIMFFFRMFFIIGKAKETVLACLQGPVKVL